MKRTRLVACGVLAAAMLVLGPGCSGRPKAVPTRGVVTLDGEPVAGVTVTFNPVAGGTEASGLTIADGSFRLTTYTVDDGALPGDYKITVARHKAVDPGHQKQATMEDMKAFQMKAMKGVNKKMMKSTSRERAEPAKTPEGPEVPPEYGDLSKTTLKAHVPLDSPLRLDLHKTGSK